MNKTQELEPFFFDGNPQATDLCYNPHDVDVDKLPVVYGFDNGETDSGLSMGVLLDSDGERIMECEAYSKKDLQASLGLLGSPAIAVALTVHAQLRDKHPGGYVTSFVKYEDVMENADLQRVIGLSGGEIVLPKEKSAPYEFKSGDLVLLKKGNGIFYKAGTKARLIHKDHGGLWLADFHVDGNPDGSYMLGADGTWYIGDGKDGAFELLESCQEKGEFSVGDIVVIKEPGDSSHFYKAGAQAKLLYRDSDGDWWARFDLIGNDPGLYRFSRDGSAQWCIGKNDPESSIRFEHVK